VERHIIRFDRNMGATVREGLELELDLPDGTPADEVAWQAHLALSSHPSTHRITSIDGVAIPDDYQSWQ
jgi:hypothetical protein